MVLDPILKQVEQAGRIPSACGHVLEVQLGPAVTDRAANDVLAGGGQHHQQRLAGPGRLRGEIRHNIPQMPVVSV